MAVRSLAFGEGFGPQLRSWRQHRKLSQLELALASDVSQRHVSWLETGKARPSRAMVIRLADSLEVPLRERNSLLGAAGYAAVYTEQAIDTPAMAPVMRSLRALLDHHEPVPAVVMNRLWHIQMPNPAMDRLLAMGGDVNEVWARIGDDGSRNLARLTLHPQGLKPYVSNWDEAAPVFVRRLRREAVSSGDPAEMDRVAELAALAALPDQREQEPRAPLLPTLPLELEIGGQRLGLFSVLSTFGTPQDITTDELRIETFFPANEATETLLRAIAAC